ncbi:MAG: bifunctional riboflavin kinase/FAD synthetase [Prevotellaceae bacterium]|jgi:riboflavin kinase/FMN adenylyltransferase|nr:bifunctional riboflavin kinase/FAD synthetase [Prevotellaceae bacterium]
MQTYYYPDIPNNQNPIATTGFFDGVHQGHHAVLSKVMAEAARQQKKSCVITFWPHPRMVLNKETEDLYLLTTLNEKKELLAKIGIDLLYIIPFTTEFAQLSPETFFKEYLREKLNIAKLIIGYDHHFGHDRGTDYSGIKQLGDTYGIEVEKVEANKLDFVNVSSTKIREAIKEGSITLVNALLGYMYSFNGKVVEGLRLGTKIGFPTANIQIDDLLKLLPREGVYAVVVTLRNNQYKGMLNIGSNPTVSDDFRIKIEVNILDFSKNIYGEEVKIEMVERIRDIEKYNSLEELAEQLKKDEEVTRFILKKFK